MIVESHVWRALRVVVVSALLGGCVGTTATPAVHGKAFVVKGNVFGTQMYNCDATGGEPECWPVREMEIAK